MGRVAGIFTLGWRHRYVGIPV